MFRALPFLLLHALPSIHLAPKPDCHGISVDYGISFACSQHFPFPPQGILYSEVFITQQKKKYSDYCYYHGRSSSQHLKETTVLQIPTFLLPFAASYTANSTSTGSLQPVTRFKWADFDLVYWHFYMTVPVHLLIHTYKSNRERSKQAPYQLQMARSVEIIYIISWQYDFISMNVWCVSGTYSSYKKLVFKVVFKPTNTKSQSWYQNKR